MVDPYARSVGAARNSIAVESAARDSYVFAALDVEDEGIARSVDTAARSP